MVTFVNISLFPIVKFHDRLQLNTKQILLTNVCFNSSGIRLLPDYTANCHDYSICIKSSKNVVFMISFFLFFLNNKALKVETKCKLHSMPNDLHTGLPRAMKD